SRCSFGITKLWRRLTYPGNSAFIVSSNDFWSQPFLGRGLLSVRSLTFRMIILSLMLLSIIGSARRLEGSSLTDHEHLQNGETEIALTNLSSIRWSVLATIFLT